MTPHELENEAVTLIFQQVVDINLQLLIYEFGKPRLNGFPKICQQAQISKTLTPGDLENQAATLKIIQVKDIALKTPVHEFGNPRPNSFLGILSANLQ